jgi:hypothetical protein
LLATQLANAREFQIAILIKHAADKITASRIHIFVIGFRFMHAGYECIARAVSNGKRKRRRRWEIFGVASVIV